MVNRTNKTNITNRHDEINLIMVSTTTTYISNTTHYVNTNTLATTFASTMVTTTSS